MIQDPNNSYVYDPEGRLCAVKNALAGTATQYVYDADGNRVAKGTINAWPAAGSTCAAPTAANGFYTSSVWLKGANGGQDTQIQWFPNNSSGSVSTLNTNVYQGGSLLATYSFYKNATNPQGLNLTFAFNDWLGTKRLQVNQAGQATNTWASDPFGNYQTASAPAGTDATDRHFTGQERDSESGTGATGTGNDYFGARYYASNLERFMSPDPSGLLFADQTNPQSYNLYNYVRNNPLSRIDPSGLTCQTNSSDGTVYDDLDGKGCDVLDKANAAAAPNVTVYGDGHTNIAQEATNSAINLNLVLYLKRQAKRFPNLPQVAPSGLELVKHVAKDTAALPNICGVGIAAYGGDRAALGLSADTQNGLQKATGANIVNIPFGATGFGMKSNITFSGGANGNVSYQLYALGGLAGIEVGTNNGDIHNHIQSVSAVASLSPNAPHNVTVYANISNLGDPACRGQNP